MQLVYMQILGRRNTLQKQREGATHLCATAKSSIWLSVVCREGDAVTLELVQPKRYGAILLDPAWQFKVWNKDTGNGRSAESHYKTMTLDDMKALPLQKLMADDCAVFMWAVMPMLPEALELGKAWGLEYKTCAFAWAKVNKRASVRQLIVSAIRKHSQKPDDTHQRIEQLVDGAYLELFARERRNGWDVIGNEIDGRDMRDVLAA